MRPQSLVPLSLLASVAVSAPAPLSAQTPPDTVEIEPLAVSILRDLTERSATAYAVSAATTEDLRLGKSGAFLEEALDMLPGVQVQNRFNFAVGERLAIRGFGPRAQFGVRGVQVLVDGIPATMPDGQSTLDHVDLASLGRAEVLRGPASALYGNAAGGVLTLRSERPDPGPVRPSGRAVLGSDGLLNVNGGVRGFVGESSLMANVSVMEYDGFRTHPTEEGEMYGAADRVLFNGQYATPAGNGSLTATLNAVTLDAENPGSIDRAALDGDLAARGFNVSQGTGKSVDQGQLGLLWDGAMAGGRTEVALWGLNRSLANPIPGTIIDLDRWAGGARVIHAGDGWGAGAELGLQHDDRLNFENEGDAIRGARTLDQTEDVRSTGLFVRGEVRPAERLTLSGAVRYDHFRFEADDDFVAGNDPDDSGSRTMDAVSPTVGAIVDAGPVELWGNVSTALETPTTTELANRPERAGGFNPDLDPARSTSFEAGVRGRLVDAFGFEVTAFHVELEDELVPFRVQQDPDRVFFRNAGRSEHDGVEVTLGLAPGSGLEAQAVYSYIDARFEEYTPEGVDVSGNRVPGLAPHRFEGRLSQERGSEEGWWFWAIEAEWVDALPVDDANSESTESYWLADLRLGLRGLQAGGVVANPYVGVSNLFDELYTAAVTVNAFGNRFYEPGPGRTAYVALSLAFPG